MEWEDYWLKAKENLEMAVLSYQNKKYNVCASRAYYAVFLASVAALIKLTNFRAEDNEWQHGQVQAQLNRQLIMRRKVLPAELGRAPMDLTNFDTSRITSRNRYRREKRREPVIERSDLSPPSNELWEILYEPNESATQTASAESARCGDEVSERVGRGTSRSQGKSARRDAARQSNHRKHTPPAAGI